MSLPPGDPVVIDGGDRSCVRLLLELRARIAGLPAGTVIHLVASDLAEPAAYLRRLVLAEASFRIRPTANRRALGRRPGERVIVLPRLPDRLGPSERAPGGVGRVARRGSLPRPASAGT